MNATDTDFYRAFAARVRTQLATTTREEDPTMSTDIAETTKGAPSVPATLRAATPHEQHPWCVSTRNHDTCMGPEISVPAPAFNDPGYPVPSILQGYLEHDSEDGWTGVVYDRGSDNPVRLNSGDELRAETALLRAHLARLDALADQLDAINEAGGNPTATTAEPGHYTWCKPGECSVSYYDDGSPCYSHEGEEIHLPAPRWIGRSRPLVRSSVGVAEDGDPSLFVSFWDEGTVYDAPQADRLIANMQALVDGMRAQRARLGEKPAAR